MSDLREEALGASGYDFDYDEKPNIDKVSQGTVGVFVVALTVVLVVVLGGLKLVGII